jgi:4-amino-4-deoxychorismate lyase
MMLVDGHPATTVNALDRGLNYGDGLFETMRLHAGHVRLLERHLVRLRSGCARLALPYPGDEVIAADIRQLTAGGKAEGVLRLVLTRGDGGRGYAPPPAAKGRRIVALHPLPPPGPAALSVGICATRLGASAALGGLKHLGRLEQVLAAAEVAAAGWDEGLMLDASDEVVAATRHNLFYLRGGRVLTPPLDGRGVAGVMRGLVLELLPTLGLAGGEGRLRYDELHDVDELFLCNAVAGVRPVKQVAGRDYGRATLAEKLRAPLVAAGVAWLA